MPDRPPLPSNSYRALRLGLWLIVLLLIIFKLSACNTKIFGAPLPRDRTEPIDTTNYWDVPEGYVICEYYSDRLWTRAKYSFTVGKYVLLDINVTSGDEEYVRQVWYVELCSTRCPTDTVLIEPEKLMLWYKDQEYYRSTLHTPHSYSKP